MKNHVGRCSLCMKECNLSFEHIPPKGAFNSSPARPIFGDSVISLVTDNNRLPWEVEGLYYDNQQKGMGKYCLCEECNNNTGSWYGSTYIAIALVVHQILSKSIPVEANGIAIKNVFPLRFIKQVISMFCSINNPEDSRFEPLRQFVLDKDAVGLDKTQYKICMYFTKSHFMKYVPITAFFKGLNSGVEQAQCLVVSEITAYPLGFILYFNPSDDLIYDGFDITGFADNEYDSKATIELPLCVLDVNNVFPTDFRTKEEICISIDDNKRRMEELGWQKEENTN